MILRFLSLGDWRQDIFHRGLRGFGIPLIWLRTTCFGPPWPYLVFLWLWIRSDLEGGRSCSPLLPYPCPSLGCGFGVLCPEAETRGVGACLLGIRGLKKDEATSWQCWSLWIMVLQWIWGSCLEFQILTTLLVYLSFQGLGETKLGWIECLRCG